MSSSGVNGRRRLLTNIDRLTLDLNWCEFITHSTEEWIMCGRGAKNGLSLIIPTISQHDDSVLEGVRWLQSIQHEQWARLGYTPQSDFSSAGANEKPPGVDLVDIENGERGKLGLTASTLTCYGF